MWDLEYVEIHGVKEFIYGIGASHGDLQQSLADLSNQKSSSDS